MQAMVDSSACRARLIAVFMPGAMACPRSINHPSNGLECISVRRNLSLFFFCVDERAPVFRFAQAHLDHCVEELGNGREIEHNTILSACHESAVQVANLEVRLDVELNQLLGRQRRLRRGRGEERPGETTL